MTEKDLDVAIEMCERIMEFDTRTMQNPVSENGWIFEKVYELLQYLRQFQFATDTNVGGTDDTISRQSAIDAAIEAADDWDGGTNIGRQKRIEKAIKALPPAQPEPLSDVYTKAVWTWLIDYQIKAAELKGRYTPYEVLSWVVNDWRKEHERSD